ncbi:tRNA lysidine(34) synthetase TilS [Pseudomonas sp. LRF_L74]|uniref:tRNA lysidine(34) synthetase TilS n=1 Tax=Pseudomonas sp. LRF_L74 TaxID=3369422 RepID=UPI003F6399A7
MSTLQQKLLRALQGWLRAPAWRLALSGGLDSTVLVHLLAGLRAHHALPPLSAIHIHHGLQAVADGWPAHCQRLCESLNIALLVERVQVDNAASLERAARDARYAAFARMLGKDEVLLMAQHRDDQAETFLLRLMRGAGVLGLAGMPASRYLGEGRLVRPLLDVSRAELLAYAEQNELEWIEDPSNADTRLSRNFLRHEVVPKLDAHWPSASQNIARSAAHLREAQALLDDLAAEDLARSAADHSFTWLRLPGLRLQPLRGLSAARQRNALRAWLARRTLLPDSDHWVGWEALRDAAPEANPVWRLHGGELRRAVGHLWWLDGAWLDVLQAPPVWSKAKDALELPGNGSLYLDGPAPPGALQVRYRLGGERMHLPGRGHRDLKRLLNEWHVPAFVRDRLPLLFVDDELLAIANLPGLDGSQHGDWRLRWIAPTNA